ncbi:MAG: glycosyltransferase [Roseburia sp.]|nr:glycosyltransferase [Roseburia sp.]MCM1242133.1 glycosyltransferase [Roseburia sp.]
MRILFVGSKKQQIPNIMFALDRMGHEVAFYPTPMEELSGDEAEARRIQTFWKNMRIDFVISNAFSSVMAQLTHELNMKYAVYGMDSPYYATYLPIFPRYDNCYLFYFDRREYQMLKERGYQNVYYLPLAADVISAQDISVTDEELKACTCDVSFVGGLYGNNQYDQYIERFPQEMQQIFSQIIEKSAFRWDGEDRVTPFLEPDLLRLIRKICPELYEADYDMPEEYYIKSFFLDRKITHVERTLLVKLLAERYDFRLYTWAHEKVPEGVRYFPPISSLTESSKVYYAGKINLNVTLRSIESGVPLRIFEIMSVGGFVLSNWQEGIEELFEEGKEIVTFKSPEEMLEKAEYYLAHDKERIRIGIGGYQKVKNCYTFEHQLEKIISILYP